MEDPAFEGLAIKLAARLQYAPAGEENELSP
jgi:hypothetical protein